MVMTRQVGVCFDEPVGKGNGTAKGIKLFDCLDKFGGFVRGKNVKVGDYPEREINLDDDDEEDCDCNHGKDDDEDEI